MYLPPYPDTLRLRINTNQEPEPDPGLRSPKDAFLIRTMVWVMNQESISKVRGSQIWAYQNYLGKGVVETQIVGPQTQRPTPTDLRGLQIYNSYF